jgi:hypothetical protein
MFRVLSRRKVHNVGTNVWRKKRRSFGTDFGSKLKFFVKVIYRFKPASDGKKGAIKESNKHLSVRTAFFPSRL